MPFVDPRDCRCTYGPHDPRATDTCVRVDHNPKLGVLKCETCERPLRGDARVCPCGSEYATFLGINEALWEKLTVRDKEAPGARGRRHGKRRKRR